MPSFGEFVGTKPLSYLSLLYGGQERCWVSTLGQFLFTQSWSLEISPLASVLGGKENMITRSSRSIHSYLSYMNQ